MGKRKSARKPVVKRKEVLEREFDCMFCNHEKSVSAKLDKENKVGHLVCKSCGVSFQTVINPLIQTDLSAPVDVYADWVDACEGVGKNSNARGILGNSGSGAADADFPDDGDDDF